MKRLSSIERVVGKVSKTEEAEVLVDAKERFANQTFKYLEGKEREKAAEEIQIIALANEGTNEIRRAYGLEDFNIPPQNIHIIKEDEWMFGSKGGAFRPELQGILVSADDSNLVLMSVIFHEMLHFKSYGALQLTAGPEPELESYRLGLNIMTRDGKNEFFDPLNEAVTEEMTIRFIKSLADKPLFADEIRLTSEMVDKYSQFLNKQNRTDFKNEILYAAELDGEIITRKYDYQEERDRLNKMIDKILEENPDTFQNRDKVFDVFAKAMITGDILPLGKLVEKTFGKGAFRKLGELGQIS